MTTLKYLGLLLQTNLRASLALRGAFFHARVGTPLMSTVSNSKNCPGAQSVAWISSLLGIGSAPPGREFV